MAEEEHKKELEKSINAEKEDVKERKAKINSENGKVYISRPKNDESHKSEDEYTCPVCGKGYKSQDGLDKHLREKHDKNPDEVKDSTEIGRIDPGVPGLKGITGGGFINNSTNLITGGPGSGKSTLALQVAVSNIEKHGIPVVYLSFEQDVDDLIRDTKQFGWNLEEKIESNKLSLLSIQPEQVRKLVSSGGGIIREEIKKAEAGILVVDSVNMFMELYQDQLEKREALLRFFHRIERWDITTFLIAEKEITPQQHSTRFIDFEVDSITLIYNIRKGDMRQRAIEIFKMRGTDHSKRIFPMRITSKGIRIYPEESVF